MKNIKIMLLFVVMASGAGFLKGQVPPGILDLSYGPASNGWTVAAFPPAIGAKADAVVMQPDGKAVVGGWGSVAIGEGPQSIRFGLPSGLPAGVYSLNLIAPEAFGSVLLVKGW